MVLFLFAFDEHIINIHLHVSPDLFLEHLVHQPLIGGPCVLESKRHDPIAVKPLVGDKGSFFLIFFSHLYLVIFGKCVHECEKLMSGGGVYQLVNSG